MKKTTTFLLIIIFSFSNLFAVGRDSDEAHQLAQKFFNTSINSGIKNAPSTSRPVQLVFSQARKNELSSNYYYIFNQANNQGFVIISGDENTKEILGYSDKNSFDPQNIPDNMKYWLSVYENEIDNINVIDARKTNAKSSKSTKVKSSSNNAFASVLPLLGGIKWNQESPYNDLCPIYQSNNRALTGCVATGMAQVMKYYEWPVTGSGSMSYTSAPHGIPLSVNFAQTTYDWANMTDTYSDGNSSTEKTAVATLMYNCGVAVKMNYSSTSIASTISAAIALKTNFGYDPNIQFARRDYYPIEEWKTMLKEELSAARPVLYAGYSGDGYTGHFFVCDGYDNDDYFHINWGWGGYSDGYFLLSALDPYNQGDGSGGFNYSQEMIIGIQKPSNTSTPKHFITTIDSLIYPSPSVGRNASFTIKVNSIFNRGINDFIGKIGLGLFDNNNVFLAEIKSSNTPNLRSNSGYNPSNFSNITIGAGIANGDYKIYCVSKPNTESDWQIVRTKVGIPNYINLKVTSDLIYMSTKTIEDPILKLNPLFKNANMTEGLVVFPNPASDHVKIQSISEILSYSIYNLLGEEILNSKTTATNEHIINTSTLSTGSYLIRIETEAGIGNFKFNKQ